MAPKPGQRVGGRAKGTPNKKTAELGELASKYAPMALAEIVRLSIQGKTEQTRLSASNMILDRAYGKPSQAMSHTGSIGTYDVEKLARLSLDELKIFENVLTKIAPTTPPAGSD